MGFAQQKINLPNKRVGPRVRPPDAYAALYPGVVTGAAAQPPIRRASTNSPLKYSCAILLLALVFENVRQRVGCGSLLTLSLREMSIAVDERFNLTAKRSRIDILTGFPVRGKTYLAPSGGDS